MLWSTWGRNWTADATAASVRALIGADLRGGGTVLLHDSDRVSAAGAWRSALDALPGLVEDCREAGLRVGPLAEHGTGARSLRERWPGAAVTRAGHHGTGH